MSPCELLGKLSFRSAHGGTDCRPQNYQFKKKIKLHLKTFSEQMSHEMQDELCFTHREGLKHTQAALLLEQRTRGVSDEQTRAVLD